MANMEQYIDKLPEHLMRKISRLSYSMWIYDNLTSLHIHDNKCLISKKTKKHQPHCIILLDSCGFLRVFTRKSSIWSQHIIIYSSVEHIKALSAILPLKEINLNGHVEITSLSNENLCFNTNTFNIEKLYIDN